MNSDRETKRHVNPGMQLFLQSMGNAVPLIIAMIGAVFWLHGEILKNRYSSDEGLRQVARVEQRLDRIESRMESQRDSAALQIKGMYTAEDARADREYVANLVRSIQSTVKVTSDRIDQLDAKVQARDNESDLLKKQVEELRRDVQALKQAVERIAEKLEADPD